MSTHKLSYQNGKLQCVVCTKVFEQGSSKGKCEGKPRKVKCTK